ncbi:hypothetical protein [Bosea sp. TAF32]|uniref:hypothetical protein n=1 Tax=Bosea sp. TAF32 TaxID=3237482 RepID=UPI003F937899
MEADISGAKTLRAEGDSTLGNFDAPISESYFKDRRFIIGTVDTRVFVLLLSHQNPKSIVNGNSINISKVLTAGNRAEFHHLYPQAFLRSKGIDSVRINALANFCILSAADNKKVGSLQPSQYKPRLADNVEKTLPGNLIPISIFDDDFEKFIDERAKILASAANKLMAK